VRDNTGSDHPVVVAGRKAVEAKCLGCHNDKLGRVPTTPWDDPKLHPWQGITDRIARHAVFNLTRPEKSSILLAPLAKRAGGWGKCAAKAGNDVITSTDDPSYRAILAMTRQAAAQLDRVKRFDMPGFLPNDAYIREMKRFGVLPEKHGVIDVYEIDRAYWKSLWWQPIGHE
jgi:hypothetical protein